MSKNILLFITLIFVYGCNNEHQLFDRWQEVNIRIGEDRAKPYSVIEKDFYIEENNKVDLVFVVDSSGSMSEEHEKLMQNFQTFINTLDTSLDVKMAMVTTDGYAINDNDSTLEVSNNFCNLPGHQVEMVGHQLFTNSNLDQAIKYLDRLHSEYIGIGGCHNERPLYYGYNMFLKNTGFRQNAHKVMIVITDEDERADCKFDI